MTELATASQIKNIDASCGIDSRELMQNAAECLFARIENSKGKYMLDLDSVAVVCGSGNNGGDGYALAILLAESGYNVNIVAADRPSASDALYYFSLCSDMGIPIVYIGEEYETACEIISHATFTVDAIFGIGLSRVPEEPYTDLIECINSSGAFVYSVDIPSGIFSDKASYHTEHGVPICVRADMTSTFVMKKAAHASFPSMPFCGDVYVEDIGIPPETLAEEKYVFFQPDDEIIAEVFAPREKNTNKGTFGTLVMLCGSDNMTGAASLAAKSAARCGVGLEVCAANKNTLTVLQNKMDFPVFLPLDLQEDGTYTEESLNALTNYKGATAFLVGCGLGKSDAARQAVEYVLKNASVPLVLDADGLNIVAENKALLQNRRCPVIITPHPGEMARLCGCSIDVVQHARTELALLFAAKYNVIVVLKGSATVIASPDGRCVFNTSGTPAMAKGGMGDVLAGIIASLTAQGKPLFESAVCGAYIHGLAGEMGEKIYSQYGLMPEDMPELVANVIKNKTPHNIFNEDI